MDGAVRWARPTAFTSRSASTRGRSAGTTRNGTIIYPKHVHKALRRYFGVENSEGAKRFPFNNTEDFAFFS